MSGVSGFFSRGADEAAERLGVRFRDTDPRPHFEQRDEVIERGLGLEALIPTSTFAKVAAQAEDERPIASLAAYLARHVDDLFRAEDYADLIREWRDGKR